MDRDVKILQPKPRLPKATRVAAYTRVSAENDGSFHSLMAQVNYYKKYIGNRPNWELIGIYTDNAKTGTKDNRPNFQRLLNDCRQGKIDLVLTKSVSRFARNTIILLGTVRELRALGIDVYFEEENLHSNSLEGELMLSIMGSVAQEQSFSFSENMKWRIRKNFEQGIPYNGTLLGYRIVGDKYQIEPEEAKIVRLIYDLYLSGMGITKISKYLNENGYKTRLGFKWCHSSVRCILSNYNYTGNLILQKTYREDYLSKRMVVNNGELPKYHAENSHEGIVSLDEFKTVQDIFLERSKVYSKPLPSDTYSLRGKIICACCQKHYIRRTTATGITWICRTYKNEGKSACPSKQIPDAVLTGFISALGGIDKIESITAHNGNILVFQMKDGTNFSRCWKDRSRAESWTPELRARQRQIALEKM